MPPPEPLPARRRALLAAALAATALARPARAQAGPDPTDPSDPAGVGRTVGLDDLADEPTTRWPAAHDLPRRPPRRIRVEIAAAHAVASHFDGREVLRTRAIVGKDRTPTPRLTSPVPSVRVNPPWYVPPSIEPEIRDPASKGYRRINGRLVLPPGPTNPLGPVRIGLVGSQGVFLHGTNAPGLFAGGNRALSHGCVRLEHAVEMAAWCVGMTPAALRAAIATGRTMEIPTADEVLVTLA